MPQIDRFNIRIYGILISKEHVLVSHEMIRDYPFTKFPGGGLQFGESPSECLKREFREELDLSIRVEKLFFIPDFVVHNYFRPEEQVLIAYYKVKPVNIEDLHQLQLKTKKSESLDETNNIRHEWVSLKELSPDYFTFPADQHVARILLENL